MSSKPTIAEVSASPTMRSGAALAPHLSGIAPTSTITPRINGPGRNGGITGTFLSTLATFPADASRSHSQSLIEPGTIVGMMRFNAMHHQRRPRLFQWAGSATAAAEGGRTRSASILRWPHWPMASPSLRHMRAREVGTRCLLTQTRHRPHRFHCQICRQSAKAWDHG